MPLNTAQRQILSKVALFSGLNESEIDFLSKRVVRARLRRLVGIIEELSFTTVRHRLAAFLIRLATQQGRKTSDGVEITLPENNQEIASQIGTVRELVSRNLSRLQSEGIIAINGRRMLICDL